MRSIRSSVLTVLVVVFPGFVSHAELVVVEQDGNAFMPQDVTVHPGDTVQWNWSNGNHTVTSGSDCTFDGRFDEQLDSANPVVAYEIPADEPPGVISYFCDPHCNMGMVGTITVELPCPADFNGDGMVNANDLALLLGNWGVCPPESDCLPDLNEDGTVNASDLALLLGSRGPCA